MFCIHSMHFHLSVFIYFHTIDFACFQPSAWPDSKCSLKRGFESISFSGGSDGKELACKVGDSGLILGRGMATHSSILAWTILWTEEPGGLQYMGLYRVGHNWAANTKLNTHKLVLTEFVNLLNWITMYLWVLKVKVKVKLLSPVWLFATPWTVAYQAPPSMESSRQECWSRLPFPSPGDLPNPGIERKDRTLVSRIGGRRFNLWATRETQNRTLTGPAGIWTQDLLFTRQAL